MGESIELFQGVNKTYEIKTKDIPEDLSDERHGHFSRRTLSTCV